MQNILSDIKEESAHNEEDNDGHGKEEEEIVRTRSSVNISRQVDLDKIQNIVPTRSVSESIS